MVSKEEGPTLSDERAEGLHRSTETTPPLTDGETKQALGTLTKRSKASSSCVQILTCFLVINAESRTERPRTPAGLIFPSC